MFESVFSSMTQTPSTKSSAPSAADQAYGPGPGTPGAPGLASFLHPATGFGLAFWLSVGGVVGLVLIYRSLPG